ncbi:MAG: helix-turn-helix transcriptional regulator [Clostridia bacterium]|nr:helix-turn-helix transcriptional regulator [Clostridia bacterium]
MKSKFLREQGRDPLTKIWHRSKDAMLLYVHAGDGHVVARERMCPLRAGTLCFIGGDAYHYTVPSDPTVYDRSKLFLDGGTLLALLSLLPAASPLHRFADGTAVACTQVSTEDCGEVEHLFSRAAARADTGGEAARLSAFLSLLLFFEGGGEEPVTSPKTPLQSAIEYIHAHVANDLTVEQICREAHVSKFHFCRLFKETIGLTVMDYVLSTRLLQAKTLLRTTTLPIGEISERCGFSSISYFSRVFRAEEGVSPRAYRRGE